MGSRSSGFVLFLLVLLCEKAIGRTTFPLPSKAGLDRQSLQLSEPFNIAHEGASGEIPEATAYAFLRAIDEGANFLKVSVQASSDGVLFCFHDLILDIITDVASRKEYENRTRTYEVDGELVTGRFAVDFTIGELTSLNVKQRYSFRDQQYNGKFGISTFEEFISIALDARKSVVGIYPEIKYPVFINEHVKWADGKKFEDIIVDTLKKYGYWGEYKSKQWKRQPVFIASYAPTSLVYIANLTDSPKILSIGDYDYRTEDTNQTFWDLTSDVYFAYISNYVIGIAPLKDTLVSTQNGALTTPSDIVALAHLHNLQVHTYLYQNEDQFLHFNFHADPYNEYNYWVKFIGVDGLITDFPGSFYQYERWTMHEDDDSLVKAHKATEPKNIFERIASMIKF